MKLAFVTTMSTAPWGGSEALWAETARHALEAKHQVLISVYRWPEAPKPVLDLQRRGALVHWRRESGRWRRSKLLNRLIDPFAAVREFAPDAVLVNQGGTYDIARGAEMGALRRCLRNDNTGPYVLLCHCEQAIPSRVRARGRARIAFASARIVGMLADNLRARTERELDIQLNNVRLFQNPLNVSAFGVVDEPSDAGLGMAFVGRLEPIKGVHTLIDALSGAEWRDRTWRLSIYGDGIQRAELERQTERLGLSSHIRFCGFVDDIDTVWRTHQLLVLPSTQEGVPNSMLEAMLSGRAVVVTNVGGIREWVRDGDSGFIAADATVTAIGSTLERAWHARTRLRDMGRTAHDQVLAKRDADPAATLLRWLEESAQPLRS